MKKFITFIFIAAIVMLTKTESAQAASQVRGSSAELTQNAVLTKAQDNRAQILRDYLIKKNSPLVDSAETFVSEADAHNIDWRLVVSISGLESSFGKRIPMDSYNGWGWGVYGDNVLRFGSWDEAIATISQGLRERYIDRMGTDDVYAIGKTYAASPTWAQRVTYFMNDLETFEKNWSDTDTLSISI